MMKPLFYVTCDIFRRQKRVIEWKILILSPFLQQKSAGGDLFVDKRKAMHI